MANAKEKTEQPILPAMTEEIQAEIAKFLTAGKAFETARIEAGQEEKKNKDAANGLMEKYGLDKFAYGEGAEAVVAKYKVEKKLKIRVGENAMDDEEDSDE